MNSDRQASERQAQANAAQQNQQQPQTQDTPKSDNPYVFSDEEKRLWGDNVTMDTAIARAWSRAYKRGNFLGNPLGEETHASDTLITQMFQFANAFMQVNDNPNQTVLFKDGRGDILSESGL